MKRLRFSHLLLGHGRRAHVVRFLIVMLGIALGQAAFYGPSLIGRKILLPLRMLSADNIYLPKTVVVPHNPLLSDLVYFQEPERIFVHNEIAAGRFPLWTPYRFAGAPLYTLGFAPHWIPAYFIKTPVILAWVQMSIAMTAGLGMYLFCRRVMKVSFWPAAIVAWCYPLTGAYILWQGWWLPAVMCWLPGILVAVDSTIRRPQGWGGPAVALITTFMLVSGAQDIAGQVLLTSGIYAVWCFFDHYGFRAWPRQAIFALGAILLAWSVGLAGSAWLMLPFNEYIHTGSRMVARSHGTEERPPMGLSELPEFVLAGMYGFNSYPSIRIESNIDTESALGGYAGLLAAMLLAPLGLGSSTHKSQSLLMVVLTFIAVSWMLNIPGMVWLLRLPVLNMMSHNRFVFVAAFCILALAGVGLEQLRASFITVRWWYEIPIILTVVLCAWCIHRVNELPPMVTNELGRAVQSGTQFLTVRNMEDVKLVQKSFVASYVIGAIGAGLVLGLWYLIRAQRSLPKWLFPAIPAVMLAELSCFGYSYASQSDPAGYFPKVDVLEQIKRGPPGRIIGWGCLPPNLAQAVGLADVRGYDGVDPSRMVQLLEAASLPDPGAPQYAATQFLKPDIRIDAAGGTHFPPILDMLGVRYAIVMDTNNGVVKPDFGTSDYWAIINKNAMPRAFIPVHVEAIADDTKRLNAMARPDFDPRALAYVEHPINLGEPAHGSATITSETPTFVAVAADTDKCGLMVLADSWDIGWSAYVDGILAPILRVNHAVRGVIVPAGKSAVEFRFAPASLRRGMQITGLAVMVLIGWCLLIYRHTWGSARTPQLIKSSDTSEFR